MKKGFVCFRFGSTITKELGGMSGGAGKVKSSPGSRMVLDGILTNLCVELVSMVSRASRDGGEDWMVQWSPMWMVPLDILQ